MSYTDHRTLPSCPWCDGEDKNFRPLRFGSVPCGNNWHNPDAHRADEPCKKHHNRLPCVQCENDKLKAEVATMREALEDCLNDFGCFGNGGVSDDTVAKVAAALGRHTPD